MKQGTAVERQAAAPTIMNSGVSQLTTLYKRPLKLDFAFFLNETWKKIFTLKNVIFSYIETYIMNRL